MGNVVRLLVVGMKMPMNENLHSTCSIHQYLPAKTINQAGMLQPTDNVMEIAFPSIVLNTYKLLNLFY